MMPSQAAAKAEDMQAKIKGIRKQLDENGADSGDIDTPKLEDQTKASSHGKDKWKKGKRNQFSDQTSVKVDDLVAMSEDIRPITLGKRIEKVFHSSGYSHLRIEFTKASNISNFSIFLCDVTGAILYNKQAQ